MGWLGFSFDWNASTSYRRVESSHQGRCVCPIGRASDKESTVLIRLLLGVSKSAEPKSSTSLFIMTRCAGTQNRPRRHQGGDGVSYSGLGTERAGRGARDSITEIGIIPSPHRTMPTRRFSQCPVMHGVMGELCLV